MKAVAVGTQIIKTNALSAVTAIARARLTRVILRLLIVFIEPMPTN